MPAGRRFLLSIGLAFLLLAGPHMHIVPDGVCKAASQAASPGVWRADGPQSGIPAAWEPPRLICEHTLAQEPADPWLLRLPCGDEATFARLPGPGVRVLLWWDGQVYILADATVRARLAAEGLPGATLDRQPSQGGYYVIWEFEDEAQALGRRYGTLVALGDGFYLLGLPPGAALDIDDGPRYAHLLPHSMVAPRPASQTLLSLPPPPPALAEMVAAVSQARLTQDVAALQDDDGVPGADALRSRHTRLPGLEIEGNYVAQQLAEAGLEVSRFPFTYDGTAHNIVGTLPGQRPEPEGFFIVCAHYDSTAAVSPGWRTGWRQMPAPGADDNASGTAAVLEAARLLGGRTPLYGVRFVLFAGEEQGTWGSEAYAQALAESGANVLGVINLDMIAYDSNHDGALEVHTGETTASKLLGQALVRNMERYAPSLQPGLFETYANQISDQAPFWSQGYPAVLVIEDREDFNYHYHKTSDTLSLLNMPYCTNVVRAVVATIGELARLHWPDLSLSRKEASYDSRLGGSVAYTVTLQNTGPVTGLVTLTDNLPLQLSVGGPVSAGRGSATWDEQAHRLTWRGEVGPGATVTLNYRAHLARWLSGALLVRHSAWVDDGSGRVYELPAEVPVPWRFVLPLILRPAGPDG